MGCPFGVGQATGLISNEGDINVTIAKRLPNAPADSHVRSILPRIRNPIYRTCCATVYACGLRSGEATALEIRTIDSTNLQLRIIGKGNKERIVPLPRPILRALRELWKTHKHPAGCF